VKANWHRGVFRTDLNFSNPQLGYLLCNALTTVLLQCPNARARRVWRISSVVKMNLGND